MMYQGLFGAFPFTVAEAEVCTFRDFKLSRELVFAEHKTLDGLPRLQHTGRNLAPPSLAAMRSDGGAQRRARWRAKRALRASTAALRGRGVWFGGRP